ncbi:hypothetical protein HN803_07485, partial [candidate division WWE3 bacterium]|nr:hypothetical protein [candidate division WWE3 bacterium]
MGADGANRNLFKGTIDYVAFYPYVLSDEEIISHFEEDTTLDTDEDGIEDVIDNCPITPNPEQVDTDEDGKGDVCDVCPQENIDDKDEDGYCEGVGFLEPMIADNDNCPLNSNPDQADVDSDGLGDVCDACVSDPNNDQDGDGLCAEVDNCPVNSNADQADSDGDDVGNSCDTCPSDYYNDIDKDSLCAGADTCPFDPNNDSDGDGLCANNDTCPFDPNNDSDGDGICGDVDECPDDPNNECNTTEEDCTGDECDSIIDPPCVGDGCGDPDPGPGPIETIIKTIGSGTKGIVKAIIHPIETVKKVVEKVVEVVKDIIIDIVPVVVVEAVQKTVVVVKKVIDNPQVEKINEKVVVPVVAVAGVANVAVGFQLPQVLNFLRNIFGQPLLLLRRRKRQKWGVIYDAFTKQPVDLATVRILDSKTGKVIRSQVTDSQGRYYIILEPGEYEIEVAKTGFIGLSEYLKNVEEDAKYINLYHGGIVKIDKENTELNYNIPMDFAEKKASTKDILKDRASKLTHYVIGLSGLAISGVSFVISPSALISGFFFGHLLFFSISYKFAYAKLPSSFGSVKITGSDTTIDRVIVRIFDAEYDKLVNTGITDKKGRYAVLVGPSKYYATYEKAGFKTLKSDVIDLSSEKTNGMGGMINKSVELEK